MKQNPAMDRLAQYFNLLADRLDLDRQTSGLASKRSDIGMNRERIVELFLSKHLPRRLKPSLGGSIFGAGGEESKQVDIIVSNDLALNFEEHGKMFIAAESVAAAITVKSFLNKEAIFDCLANLASIPQLSPSVLGFKILKPDSFEIFSRNHPALYVFAFDGLSVDTLVEHIMTFYKENPNLPLNRVPIGIIVNRKFFVRFSPFEPFITSTGESVPAGNFHKSIMEDHMRGYPLVQIVNRITDYVDWLPFMTLHNEVYLGRAFGVPPS